MSERQRLGRDGEACVAAHLEAHGFRVLARNWRSRFGELDLVAARRDLLLFVEVKTRRSRRFGSGAASVTTRKRARILQTARAYLARHGDGRERVRFDVVEVEPTADGYRVVAWIAGAFGEEG